MIGHRSWTELFRPAALLFFLGVALRVLRLDTLPPALFRDEAEKAYNAYSILLTGRDVNGQFLPLFINVFGVTTSAIYQYACVPFVALLGLNEWSARLPAATIGVITLIVTYALVMRERNRQAALWAVAFLALSPWHIVFSRWAQQGIFLPLLLATAMLGWRYSLDGRRYAIVLTGACLALAIYAYDPARLFVPLLMLWWAIVYAPVLVRQWRFTLLGLAAFLVVVAPTAVLVLTQTDMAQARFRAISIFEPGQGAVDTALHFARHYAEHFSLSFLVLQGDPELRHSAGVGVLTAIEFLALIFGVVAMLARRRREDLLWLGWLLLFPVSASLTKVGIPHALRTIVALPVIQVIAGVGMSEVLFHVRRSRQATFRHAAILMLLLSFLPFVYKYFVTYSSRSAINWQYGVKQALNQIAPVSSLTDSIAFYNIFGAEYLVPFYAQVPPQEVQTGGLTVVRKYRIVPYNYPLQRLYDETTGSAIFVMLPIYPPPLDATLVSVNVPGTEEPALHVAANSTFRQRLREDPEMLSALPTGLVFRPLLADPPSPIPRKETEPTSTSVAAVTTSATEAATTTGAAVAK